MNKKYVLNFDDVEDEFDSTCELAPTIETVLEQRSDDVAAALQRAMDRFSPSSEGTVGSEYRFRAECQHDADVFMNAISAYVEYPWTIISGESGYNTPDVTVQFRLEKAIRPRSLLWAANVLVDGHVITQTLALAEHYDGKRDLDLHPDIHLIELLPSEDEMKQLFESSTEYAEQLQSIADRAEEHAACIFGVMATAYTTKASKSDDTEWFDEMLKLNA